MSRGNHVKLGVGAQSMSRSYRLGMVRDVNGILTFRGGLK